MNSPSTGVVKRRKRMDTVLDKIRYARLVWMDHAAKEAACAIHINKLRQSIRVKQEILRTLTEKRQSADQVVQSKLHEFREQFSDADHPEAMTSDFDITSIFPVTKAMLRNDPTPSPAKPLMPTPAIPSHSKEEFSLPIATPSPYSDTKFVVSGYVSPVKDGGSEKEDVAETNGRQSSVAKQSVSRSPENDAPFVPNRLDGHQTSETEFSDDVLPSSPYYPCGQAEAIALGLLSVPDYSNEPSPKVAQHARASKNSPGSKTGASVEH